MAVQAPPQLKTHWESHVTSEVSRVGALPFRFHDILWTLISASSAQRLCLLGFQIPRLRSGSWTQAQGKCNQGSHALDFLSLKDCCLALPAVPGLDTAASFGGGAYSMAVYRGELVWHQLLHHSLKQRDHFFLYQTQIPLLPSTPVAFVFIGYSGVTVFIKYARVCTNAEQQVRDEGRNTHSFSSFLLVTDNTEAMFRHVALLILMNIHEENKFANREALESKFLIPTSTNQCLSLLNVAVWHQKTYVWYTHNLDHKTDGWVDQVRRPSLIEIPSEGKRWVSFHLYSSGQMAPGV